MLLCSAFGLSQFLSRLEVVSLRLFLSCHAEDFISYAPCISGPPFEFSRKQKQKQSLHRFFSQQGLLTGMSFKATWTCWYDLSRHGLVPVPCSQVNQSLQLLL